MKKILFLDFDGVLVDTVDEAYKVCINTKRFKDIVLPKNSLEIFRKYRALIGPAWNYFYVMNSIVNKTHLKTGFIFQKNKEALEFEKDFFETRVSLKNTNYKDWLTFNEQYPFLTELAKLEKNIDLTTYIITTKDKQTVIDLLRQYNINFIDKNRIYGKDIFNTLGSKKDIISNILSSIDDNYSAIFIDDLAEHLNNCSNIKELKLIQADWGYVDVNSKSSKLYNMKDTLRIINKL